MTNCLTSESHAGSSAITIPAWSATTCRLRWQAQAAIAGCVHNQHHSRRQLPLHPCGGTHVITQQNQLGHTPDSIALHMYLADARPACHTVPDSVSASCARTGNAGRNRIRIVHVNLSTIADNQAPGMNQCAR